MEPKTGKYGKEIKPKTDSTVQYSIINISILSRVWTVVRAVSQSCFLTHIVAQSLRKSVPCYFCGACQL